MNEIAASVAHKKQGNDVGVHQEHDEDEVERRVSVTRSKVLNANNTPRRTVEEHDIGPDYFAMLDIASSTHHDGLYTKIKHAQIAGFFERTRLK